MNKVPLKRKSSHLISRNDQREEKEGFTLPLTDNNGSCIKQELESILMDTQVALVY